MKNKLIAFLLFSIIMAGCILAACFVSKQKGEVKMDISAQDTNTADVITFTSNSDGNRQLKDSPYGYEMWAQSGNNNKLIWYGPNQRGGAAFRAEWNNADTFLGRVGFYWGNGGKYTDYKNLYADFDYKRSMRNTAGNHSYIGIYGWARNPSAEKPEDRLVEYYIVEDWYGNKWQDDETPVDISTTGGKIMGYFKIDGAVYIVVRNVREEMPSIEGTKTFVQFFSIRQTPRKKGTISITEHFKQWERMGLILGNMYEAKFLVEAGGGTGWMELSYLKLTQEDNPRKTD